MKRGVVFLWCCGAHRQFTYQEIAGRRLSSRHSAHRHCDWY